MQNKSGLFSYISLIQIFILIRYSNNYIIIPFKSTKSYSNLKYDDNSPDFISKFKKELDNK